MLSTSKKYSIQRIMICKLYSIFGMSFESVRRTGTQFLQRKLYLVPCGNHTAYLPRGYRSLGKIEFCMTNSKSPLTISLTHYNLSQLR